MPFFIEFYAFFDCIISNNHFFFNSANYCKYNFRFFGRILPFYRFFKTGVQRNFFTLNLRFKANIKRLPR